MTVMFLSCELTDYLYWRALFMGKWIWSVILPNFWQKLILCYENLWYEYELLYARMFEGKCTKLHMDIVWWYDHDSIYESLHICMQMKKIHDYIRLDPFTWRQLFGSLLVKAVKAMRSLYLGGTWPKWDPSKTRGTWIPL